MPGRVLPLVAAVVVLSGVTHVARTHAFQHHLQTQTYEDRYYLPPPDWLVIASAGYREAAADLVWVATLNNFGQELQHHGPSKYLFHYGDAAIALDPRFRRAYIWAGTMSLYRLARAGLEDAERAAGYLLAALSQFPDDGELLWLLGAHYSYEMPPLVRDAGRRAEIKRKGLDYLGAAALLGAGPPWLPLIAASGLESLGEKERSIRYLSEVYLATDDPEVKAELSARIRRLKDESFLEAIDRAEVQMRQAKQREFPYMPDALYLLVGPRPPFDDAAQLSRYFDPMDSVIGIREPFGHEAGARTRSDTLE